MCVFQGYYKHNMFRRFHTILRNKCTYLCDFYSACANNLTASVICNRWGLRFRLLVRGYGIIMTLTVIGFTMSPFIVYLFTEKLELMLPAYIPGVDERESNGYILHYVLHVIIVIAAAAGLFASDLVIFLLILHVCVISEVIISKLRELDGCLKQSGQDYDRRTQQYLFNIVRLHQALCIYIIEISELFDVNTLFEVMLDVISMCLILFTLMQFSWIPLYVLFLLYVFKLFVVCLLGTLLEISVSVKNVVE